MNTPKRANVYKIRNADYKEWTLKTVIETFSDKSYEEVKKEQEEKNYGR